MIQPFLRVSNSVWRWEPFLTHLLEDLSIICDKCRIVKGAPGKLGAIETVLRGSPTIGCSRDCPTWSEALGASS